MIINAPKHGYSHEYMMFDKASWSETGVMKGVKKGGKINRILTNVRESGSLPVSGYAITNTMVRIYATDLETNRRFAVATMRVTRPSADVHHSSGEVGDATLTSVLTFAEQDGPDGAFVVHAGESPVEAAASIFRSLGLPVNASINTSALTHDRVYWKEDWNWLTIANDLLDAANYPAADVDRYGTVIIKQRKDLAEQSPVAVFSDVDVEDATRRKFQSPIKEDDDWADVPNVYELFYENQDATFSSVAIDNNSDSRLSIDSRGYRVKRTETVTDIGLGESPTEQEIQEKLDALVIQKLKASQSNVAATEFNGQYVDGLNISDAVELKWVATNRDYVRSVYSMEITLSNAMPVHYRIREYMRGGNYEPANQGD